MVKSLNPVDFLTGFIGGVIFSYTFIVFRKQSLKRAYWVTVGVHGAENLLVAVGLIFLPGILPN